MTRSDGHLPKPNRNLTNRIAETPATGESINKVADPLDTLTDNRQEHNSQNLYSVPMDDQLG